MPYAFSCDSGEVSREQIEKLLPFLAGRVAYLEYYVEMRIGGAFRCVRGAKKGQVLTPKAHREELLNVAAALAVIERAKSACGEEDDCDDDVDELDEPRLPLPPILSQVSVAEIRQQREFLEWMAVALPPPRKEGGKRNLGREIAVREAYRLLISFGDKKRPGRTRGGPWNEIANILYEDPNPDADLFKTINKFSQDELFDENDFDLDAHFRTRTEQK